MNTDALSCPQCGRLVPLPNSGFETSWDDAVFLSEELLTCKSCLTDPPHLDNLSLGGQFLNGLIGTLVTAIILTQQLSVLLGQGKMGYTHLQGLTVLELVVALVFQIAFGFLLVRSLQRIRAAILFRQHAAEKKAGRPPR